MPKTIDYPRTTYTSAWEVAEVVDDTGGKASLETTARKLNRKVSGSFKAIVGSAVKFGLLTSKRELLTTTNLFRRIKHAYDKAEERIYHREAFLHPPLFMQICRKFRNRELPVHMLDVMLIREFAVEEINAQNVARAFVEGARMVDVLDERNYIADVDQLATKQGPRRELANSEMPLNIFQPTTATAGPGSDLPAPALPQSTISIPAAPALVPNASLPGIPESDGDDPVSALFGLPRSSDNTKATAAASDTIPQKIPVSSPTKPTSLIPSETAYPNPSIKPTSPPDGGTETTFRIQLSGPGIHTDLTIQDLTDLAIVQSLLDKIRRRLE